MKRLLACKIATAAFLALSFNANAEDVDKSLYRPSPEEVADFHKRVISCVGHPFFHGWYKVGFKLYIGGDGMLTREPETIPTEDAPDSKLYAEQLSNMIKKCQPLLTVPGKNIGDVTVPIFFMPRKGAPSAPIAPAPIIDKTLDAKIKNICRGC